MARQSRSDPDRYKLDTQGKARRRESEQVESSEVRSRRQEKTRRGKLDPQGKARQGKSEQVESYQVKSQ